jgi:hypothetical protein
MNKVITVIDTIPTYHKGLVGLQIAKTASLTYDSILLVYPTIQTNNKG